MSTVKERKANREEVSHAALSGNSDHQAPVMDSYSERISLQVWFWKYLAQLEGSGVCVCVCVGGNGQNTDGSQGISRHGKKKQRLILEEVNW